MTPSTAAAVMLLCLNFSRLFVFEICTSILLIEQLSNASLSAMEVCAYAAGFMISALHLFCASWTMSIKLPSAFDCRKSMDHCMLSAFFRHRFSTCFRLAVPYISTSRVPKRFRLAPFIIMTALDIVNFFIL